MCWTQDVSLTQKHSAHVRLSSEMIWTRCSENIIIHLLLFHDRQHKKHLETQQVTIFIYWTYNSNRERCKWSTNMKCVFFFWSAKILKTKTSFNKDKLWREVCLCLDFRGRPPGLEGWRRSCLSQATVFSASSGFLFGPEKQTMIYFWPFFYVANFDRRSLPLHSGSSTAEQQGNPGATWRIMSVSSSMSWYYDDCSECVWVLVKHPVFTIWWRLLLLLNFNNVLTSSANNSVDVSLFESVVWQICYLEGAEN